MESSPCESQVEFCECMNERDSFVLDKTCDKCILESLDGKK